MDIQPDTWLTGLFGHPAYAVRGVTPGPDAESALARHMGEQSRAFYFAKVDTREVEAVRRLSRAGMYVVDVNVVFELSRPPSASPASVPGVEVGECGPSDIDAVLDIARTAFRFSRFHLDPQVPPALAGGIKREWVQSYIRGVRGERLFVARHEGVPAGFLAALRSGEAGDTAVIDLVAVARDRSRRRIGEALVSAFVAHYRSAAARLVVGTQVANTPSTRLYEKLGFSLSGSQYVLHGHVRDGVAV